MKINNPLSGRLNPYGVQAERLENNKTNENAAAEAAATAPKGDRISLSPEARLRTEALNTALAAPDVRQAKVDAIREKIEDGTYTIDSKNIAGKMLQEGALLGQTLES